MSDVFLSYSRADRDKIASLVAALEAAGEVVWWDRFIGGGEEFSEVIEKELARADWVVVAWSQHSLHSHWVRDEAEFARTSGKLIPVSLDGVLPPLGFRQMHALDFSNWRGGSGQTEFIELVRALKAKNSNGSRSRSLALEAARSSIEVREPSIQIIPFENFSRDEDLGYLGKGLAEDISTNFVSNRHFQIIAWPGELQADYRLEGALRRTGKRTRVNAKLVDAISGAQIWSDRFDALSTNLFKSADEIAGRISARASSEITLAEAHRAEQLPPERQGPWETAMRSWVAYFDGRYSPMTIERTLASLKKSLDAFPDFSLNHAILSWTAFTIAIHGMYEGEEVETYFDLGHQHLQRARQLAGNDISTLIFIGAAENFAGMNERSIKTLEGVLARDPYNAEAQLIISIPYVFVGRTEDGMRACERVWELAPEAYFANGQKAYYSIIHFLLGKYALALSGLVELTERAPANGWAGVLKALTHMALDQCSEAEKSIYLVKKTNPQLNPNKLRALVLSQPDKEKGEREYSLLCELWSAVTDPKESTFD